MLAFLCLALYVDDGISNYIDGVDDCISFAEDIAHRITSVGVK
jgi:hypothetical protein